MAHNTLSEILKRKEQLLNELAVLEVAEEELNTPTNNLAEYIHDRFCGGDHCYWCYDYFQNNPGYRNQYLRIAGKILETVTFQEATVVVSQLAELLETRHPT